MAERVGFEPTDDFSPDAFKAPALNRSAISLQLKSEEPYVSKLLSYQGLGGYMTLPVSQ